MPDKQQVEFIIKADGTVVEKVTGVGGPDCEDVTRAIEESLGEIVDRERTSDYYNNKNKQTSDGTVSTSA